MSTSRTRGLAVAALCLLASCGSGSPVATSASPSPATSSSPIATPPPAQNVRILTFKLRGCVRKPATSTACLPTWAGNPVQGTVRVEVSGDGYTMAISVKGLTPKSGHEINTHTGTCSTVGNSLGLPDSGRFAIADSKGLLTNVTTWPGAYFVPPSGMVLSVHGNAENDALLTHIACADLTN